MTCPRCTPFPNKVCSLQGNLMTTRLRPLTLLTIRNILKLCVATVSNTGVSYSLAYMSMMFASWSTVALTEQSSGTGHPCTLNTVLSNVMKLDCTWWWLLVGGASRSRSFCLGNFIPFVSVTWQTIFQQTVHQTRDHRSLSPFRTGRNPNCGPPKP